MPCRKAVIACGAVLFNVRIAVRRLAHAMPHRHTYRGHFGPAPVPDSFIACRQHPDATLLAGRDYGAIRVVINGRSGWGL